MHAIAIILFGIIVLFVSLILLTIGLNALLYSIMSILAPLVAIFIGLLGISFFGRESFLKEDRYHTFNVWIALGLIFFSLADITAILVFMTEDASQICFAVSLVQVPGLFLWVLGILGYFKALNASLRLTEGTQLWLAVGVITTLASLSLVVIFAIISPTRNILATIVGVPVIVVLGLIVCVISGILWVFREGYIARSLALLLFGVVLLLIRSIFWQVEDYCGGNPLSPITAIESYLLVGASFLLANNLNLIFESSEEGME